MKCQYPLKGHAALASATRVSAWDRLKSRSDPGMNAEKILVWNLCLEANTQSQDPPSENARMSPLPQS